MSTAASTESLLRVERGHVCDEELAALTAVLLARTAGPARRPESGAPECRRIDWRVRPRFIGTRSWQA